MLANGCAYCFQLINRFIFATNHCILGYPLILLPKDIQQLFEKVIKQCSESKQRSFLDACIKSMINDMGKGESWVLIERVSSVRAICVVCCFLHHIDTIFVYFDRYLNIWISNGDSNFSSNEAQVVGKRITKGK